MNIPKISAKDLDFVSMELPSKLVKQYQKPAPARFCPKDSAKVLHEGSMVLPQRLVGQAQTPLQADISREVLIKKLNLNAGKFLSQNPIGKVLARVLGVK